MLQNKVSIYTNIPRGRLADDIIALVRLDNGTTEIVPEGRDLVSIVATFPVRAAPPELPPPASAARPWMAFAWAELGVTETAGAGSNPRVEAYHRSAGGTADDSVPWCSSFVNFCITQSGLPGTNSKRARSWLVWGRPLPAPQLGCVAVLERGNPPKGHVGFYVGGTANEVRLLGGNQGDKVSVATYEARRVIGWRWPTDQLLAQRPATRGDALAGIDAAGLPLPRDASNLESLRDEYRRYFTACRVRPDRVLEADASCRRIEASRARYEALGQGLDIPWHVIGVLHHMECNCAFDRHLHNGDPLTARTVRKPAGRPAAAPSNGITYTWEESAADALADLARTGSWAVERLLFQAERFNGWGYRWRGLPSAYLWSGSNLYVKGKFPRDGVFDPELVSDQIGVGTLLRRFVDRAVLAGN